MQALKTLIINSWTSRTNKTIHYQAATKCPPILNK